MTVYTNARCELFDGISTLNKHKDTYTGLRRDAFQAYTVLEKLLSAPIKHIDPHDLS